MPSERILKQKEKYVDRLAEKMKAAVAGVVVNYKGISVADDTKLRRDLREAGVEYAVVKNTLLHRAAEKVGLEDLQSVLKGSTALALSSEDYVAAARILSKFADTNKSFEVKAGFVEGKVIDQKDVAELAKMPSKEVLVARALGGLNAPISGFVYVLNANLRGLVVALNAIAEKKSA
ncbi:MAG: 50S ribosomal protein L10 [Oscillospiraceae bacterium]|nr:50S ribosomal protein L10 [Oscillospiraceae bacterium]MDD4413480.1 50S ribosomal protein L10 [Oscillospiraceae bacterium]